MTRPVIGIPTPVEPATWGVWQADCAIVALTYIGHVQRAGGIAVLLPPDEELTEDPSQVLEGVDALLLVGGADVDPSAYGADPHPQTGGTRPERDAFEVALVHGALERDLPLLGVCRGMQVLNVARGGTLNQHVPDLVGHEDHRRVPGAFGDHEVQLEPGSLAARAAGAQVVATKSHHHQAVDRIGEGLRVTGWSVHDELPEAVELPAVRYALGVQWHPEADESSAVIASLVAEARTRAVAA